MEIIISLVILGILLLIAELLLVPGVGIAGITGFVSLAASCCYAFVKLGPDAGWITVAVVLVLIVIFTIVALRAKTWKRFELKTEIEEKTNTAVNSIKVGDTGKARTRLAPMGTAVIAGLNVEVKTEDNSLVSPGEELVVVAIEDNRILVRTTNKQ